MISASVKTLQLRKLSRIAVSASVRASPSVSAASRFPLFRSIYSPHISTVPFSRTYSTQNSNNPISEQLRTLQENLLKVQATASSFKDRVERNVVIVDKTRYLYDLVTEQNSAFVRGPRRIGKSLNLSTVDAIFTEGKEWWNEHCKELAIVKEFNYDFPVHPVLDLDFSSFSDANEMKDSLESVLRILIAKHGMNEELQPSIELYKENKNIIVLFEDTIKRLAMNKKKGVVILIDEYDAPINRRMTDLTKQAPKSEDNQKYVDNDTQMQELIYFMNKLFTSIKRLRKSRDIRFCYVTGVMPLIGLGLFSGPNDTFQTALNRKYDGLLGYTGAEIEHYFKDHIEILARMICDKTPIKPTGTTTEQIEEQKKKQQEYLDSTKQDILRGLKHNYNGFVFDPQQKHAFYSAFAINSFFETMTDPEKLKLGTIEYKPHFVLSGSSVLIWRAVANMKLQQKTTFFYALQNKKCDTMIFEKQMSYSFISKQSLSGLFHIPAVLLYLSGTLSIVRESSTDQQWDLKIVNNEMRQCLLNELQNALDVENDDIKLLSCLEEEDYHEYFDIIAKGMLNMSVLHDPTTTKLSPSASRKHELEVEGYGRCLLNLIHKRLDDSDKSRRINFTAIYDKSIGENRKRPDCIITFDKPKTKQQDAKDDKGPQDKGAKDADFTEHVAIIMEYKCTSRTDESIKQAEECLREKYADITNQKLKQEYDYVKDRNLVFAAVALGFGRIQKVVLYKKDQKGKFVELDTWPRDEKKEEGGN